MAQAKLNDFFSSKKKQDINPAKRRKVEVRPTTRSSRSNSAAAAAASPLQDSLSLSHGGNIFKSDLAENALTEPFQFDAVRVPESTVAANVCDKASSALKSVSRTTRSTLSTQKRNTRSKKKQGTVDKNQPKLTDLISNETNEDHKCSLVIGVNEKLAPDIVSDEVTTSIVDDHDHVMSGMSTPRKRTIKMDKIKDVPTTRQKKLAPRRLSDEGHQETVKKNLDSTLSSTPVAEVLTY